MSNKTQLQTNNNTLDALITRVNAAKDTAASLPEADSGGGSSGSNETVTITYESVPDPGQEIWYLDETQMLRQEAITKNGTYTILKGTLLVVTNYAGTNWTGLTHIGGNGMYRIFLATG